MVILIAGCSHTGKTLLAQKLLEKYKYPCLSIDHLKMGLIRSKMTDLTPEDDGELTGYLWPILREIIKTAVENGQNLILEGCYIPFDWRESFEERYVSQIIYRCLIMTEEYISRHFGDIQKYENVIEHRLTGGCLSPGDLIAENNLNLKMCEKYHCDYLLIQDNYDPEMSFPAIPGPFTNT